MSNLMQPTRKFRVMISRFFYGGWEQPDVADFIIGTTLKIKEDDRLSNDIINWRKADTPITICRNEAFQLALQKEVDFLLMVDNDMKPDAYLSSNPHGIGTLPDTRPFWDSSIDWLIRMRKRGQPSVIGAPYCGPPPHENVYVFKWETHQNDVPEDQPNWKLEQFSRREAMLARGIEEVAALPTGLIIFDMDAIRALPTPHTYYEYDEKQTEKHSTEDVTLTRDLSLQGYPQYCNWDAWAGHWKMKCVGKPHVLGPRDVSDKYRDAVRDELQRELNVGPGEELMDWKPRSPSGNGKKEEGRDTSGRDVVLDDGDRSR